MEQVGRSKMGRLKAGVSNIRRDRGRRERVAVLLPSNNNEGEEGSL
jgi:hypothetical protein